MLVGMQLPEYFDKLRRKYTTLSTKQLPTDKDLFLKYKIWINNDHPITLKYISVSKSKMYLKIHINIDINIVSVKFIVYSFFKDGHCVGSCISHLPYTCVDKDIITININGFYLFSRKHFHMCVYISKVSVPDDIFSIITSKWKLIHCYINTCCSCKIQAVLYILHTWW